MSEQNDERKLVRIFWNFIRRRKEQESRLILRMIFQVFEQNAPAVKVGRTTPCDRSTSRITDAQNLANAFRCIVGRGALDPRSALEETLALGKRDRVRFDMRDPVECGARHADQAIRSEER